MGYLNVLNIQFDENVSAITKPFVLKIQFESLKSIKEGIGRSPDIDWKFVFVGNSHDSRFDQVLDTITMEEVEFGMNEFTWEVRHAHAG